MFIMLVAMQVFWVVSFMIAVRPTSRRAGTRDERRGCDRRANLLYTRGEAREGYARVSFLGARGAELFEILRFIAPRKILRDSPTRRGTPKKLSACSVDSLLFGGRCFGQ